MSENQGNKTIQELLAISLDDHYGSFVSAYADRMLRYASSLGASSYDAQESVQEAFIRVYRALQSFSSKKICSMKLEAYLCMTVHNCVKTRITSKRKAGGGPGGGSKKAISFSALSLPSEYDEGLPFDQIDEREDGPEVAYLKKEMRGEIIALLSYLPNQRSRNIVLARYFGDFTVQELAENFGLSISAIKSILQRSFRTLRGIPEVQQIKETR